MKHLSGLLGCCWAYHVNTDVTNENCDIKFQKINNRSLPLNNICTLLTVIILAHADFVEICPYLLPNSTDCFPKSIFTGGYVMCGFEMETQLSEPSN